MITLVPALLFSLIIGDWIIDSPFELVMRLKNNPESTVNSFLYALFILGILPVSIVLAFFVIAYVLESEYPSGIFANPLFYVPGGFMSFWGFLISSSAYYDYFKIVKVAVEHSLNQANNHLLTFGVMGIMHGVLWIVTGVSLTMFSYKEIRASRR